MESLFSLLGDLIYSQSFNYQLNIKNSWICIFRPPVDAFDLTIFNNFSPLFKCTINSTHTEIDSYPLTCELRCPPAFSVSVTAIHPWIPFSPANSSLSPVFSSLWCLNPAMLLCLHCHPLGPCSILSPLNWTPISDFLGGPLHPLLYLPATSTSSPFAAVRETITH